ncbi:hypothetical protein [Falsihalocynthiibacter arcticus]|uniref:hypothetical protein n=1 Tax=Falsihalocynthiibacter arcticus TaxID=1579316 RepID=UPI0012E921F3|nr:hypothetical protein [Falsihalocynthiibacter arcticus]
MFSDAWHKQCLNTEEESKRLRTRVRQIESEIEAFLGRVVQTQENVTVRAYERKIVELQSERALVAERIETIAVPHKKFEDMFELSMRFLANPHDVWKKGGHFAKRTVLRLAFARPLSFDREKGVRTAETTLPFKALRFLASSESKMVHPRGFEPLTP